MITDSDCSTLATGSCSGHQALQSCHDLEGGHIGDINLKNSCTQSQNCEASDQTENHITESDEARQFDSAATLVNNSVRKVRKKSKRISDIDANGFDR